MVRQAPSAPLHMHSRLHPSWPDNRPCAAPQKDAEMTIPTLKRVKIASERELRDWLARHPQEDRDIMVVSVANRENPRHVARDAIVAAAESQGWHAGRAHTLTGGLRGQVIHRARS
jgi:hypothetical protein